MSDVNLKRYKGIIYIILSAFCFALMNVFVRLAGDVPSIQKSFFRNSVALVFAGIMIFKGHVPLRIGKGNMKYMLMRSVFGTIGILCNFYAVDHLMIADASMLNKMSPFFAIIFSLLILKEKVAPVQALAVAGAFAGSLFIIKPTFLNMDLGPSLIGLLGGVGAGAAYTLVRKMGERGVKGPLIVGFFSAFSCLVTLPVLLFDYHPMTGVQLGILIMAGLAASGGQFAITAAYFYAPAREISVYDYSQIIFAALLGFIVFGQVPDVYSIIGYVMICAMAIWMFIYNNKKRENGCVRNIKKTH